jgi:hypothetical protein
MGNVIIGKQAQPKPFHFDPLSKKVGDDEFTLVWDAGLERFDFRKNGGLVISDINTQCCLRRAKAMGVEFDIRPAEKLEVKK